MQILIIDLGSQYTLVLARRLRELGIQPTVLPPEEVDRWLKETKPKPKGIILTGGDKSVYDDDAIKIPSLVLKLGIPTLGICYGMHALAHAFGGEVKKGQTHKYGHQEIKLVDDGILFNNIQSHQVWASHKDTVTQVPSRFAVDATYKDGTIAAMSAGSLFTFGIQFHPEVTHTISGQDILKNFVFGVCNCVKDWNPPNIIEDIQQQVRETVGGKRAVLALSGGVDSLTLARTINFLGSKLRAVLIDTGGLREGEVERAKSNAELVGVNLRVVDMSQFFIDGLGSDNFPAEEKRQIFKNLYKLAIEYEARVFGDDECVLIQGTILPDMIESGAIGRARIIKSHHNVNQNWNHVSLEPFSDLFKFEVRALARFFELYDIAEQMPFPGPGLLIRIIGAPITRERLEIVRWADHIVTQILKNGGVYESISQLVVALVAVDTVGIKGDHRAYGPAILVRSVVTEDFMTARGYHIARDLRDGITNTLCEHPDICRVWYDETSKPPGTIEVQ